MFDIEIKKKGSCEVVDSKLLYSELGVKSQHADWMRRRIDNYGFEDGKDYFLLHISDKQKGRGGHNRKDYLLTLDMAKELCMIENNDQGKATRRYFIAVEKEFRKREAVRLAGIEARKGMTDLVYQSGEDERMHGRGYSNYTRLVYQLTGLYGRFTQYRKDHGSNGFRDSLSVDDLKRVELAESLIKPLLEMDKQYSEIRDTLKPLFKTKEIT